MFRDQIDTPLGPLTLVVDAKGTLWAAGFTTEHDRMSKHLKQLEDRDGALISRTDPSGVSSAMQRYFEGDTHAIEAVEVDALGTDFQRQVWTALREIPSGETWTYGQLAQHIGRPKAVRAVGLANGANPVSIVVPCHRVIGANGTLTGYGGGLRRKKWLLGHENPSRQISLPY